MFDTLHAWHWLVLGLVLIGAEALGTGGVFIGTAMAAFISAILKWIVPDLAWEMQLIIFSILAVIFSATYYKLFRKLPKDAEDHPNLNNRSAQMVGKTTTLTEALPATGGKIHFGDTLWSVQPDQAYEAETIVRVVRADGMTLFVEKAE